MAKISKIVVLADTDDILQKQLDMLKERHGSELETVGSAKELWECVEGVGDAAGAGVLVITDDQEVADECASRGIETRHPATMRESYLKAMQMLGSRVASMIKEDKK